MQQNWSHWKWVRWPITNWLVMPIRDRTWGIPDLGSWTDCLCILSTNMILTAFLRLNVKLLNIDYLNRSAVDIRSWYNTILVVSIFTEFISKCRWRKITSTDYIRHWSNDWSLNDACWDTLWRWSIASVPLYLVRSVCPAYYNIIMPPPPRRGH